MLDQIRSTLKNFKKNFPNCSSGSTKLSVNGRVTSRLMPRLLWTACYVAGSRIVDRLSPVCYLQEKRGNRVTNILKKIFAKKMLPRFFLWMILSSFLSFFHSCFLSRTIYKIYHIRSTSKNQDVRPILDRPPKFSKKFQTVWVYALF